jgi:hypothetical protein
MSHMPLPPPLHTTMPTRHTRPCRVVHGVDLPSPHPRNKGKFFVYTAVFDQYRDNKRKNFLYSVNNPDFRASGEK